MAHTVNIGVDDAALQEFRRAVFAKYGILYGKIREEASRALRVHARTLGKFPSTIDGASCRTTTRQRKSLAVGRRRLLGKPEAPPV